MIEENARIDEESRERRKAIIGQIRKEIFELENENLCLKNPKKNHEIEDLITNLIKRKAVDL